MRAYLDDGSLAVTVIKRIMNRVGESFTDSLLTSKELVNIHRAQGALEAIKIITNHIDMVQRKY